MLDRPLPTALPARDAQEINIQDISDSDTEPEHDDLVVVDPPPPSDAQIAEQAMWDLVKPVMVEDSPHHQGLHKRAAMWGDTSLLFLGTGSAEPQKYRGPTAVLLRVRPFQSDHSF